jgi:4-amino-4-deoxy-L-arabinose transferase-like glycosyltransferase
VVFVSFVAPRYRILFLTLACYAGLFFDSSNLPFVGADEPRYSRVAQEMLTSGDWVIPHLEGRPWLEKPPLYYWGTAILFRLFGTGEAQARLTSGLAILGLVVSILIFGRRWFSPQVGWLAALMFSTCMGAIAFSHAASMDALFSFLLFFGLGAAFDALLVCRRWALLEWLLSAVALAGAVLAKGLIGLILPIGILLVFLVWEEAWRQLRWFWLALWLLVFLLLAVPWHVLAYQRAGFDFLAIYLVNHHLARFFTEIHHHTQPVYYYFPVVFAGLLPWSILLPLIFRRRIANSNSQNAYREAAAPAWRLLLWTTFFIVGFFSISASKLPGYVLPVFAPLALLTADGLSRWLEDPLRREERLKRAALGMAIVLALLGTAASFLLSRRYNIAAQNALLVGLMFWVGALMLVWLVKRRIREVDSVVATTAGAQALMVLLLSLLCLNQIGWYHSTKDIMGMATAIARPGDRLASYRFFHHSLAYYSNYAFKGNLDAPEKVQDELHAKEQGFLYLIVEPRWLVELQAQCIAPGCQLEVLGSRGPLLLTRLTPQKLLK